MNSQSHRYTVVLVRLEIQVGSMGGFVEGPERRKVVVASMGEDQAAGQIGEVVR